LADESKDYSGSPEPQGEVKTFTQEDVNNIVAEVKAKKQRQIDEAVEKALKDASERQRIESLQGEERLKAEYEAKLNSVEAERAKREEELRIATRELAISKAEAQLASLNLPTEFAVNLLGEDDKQTAKNIQTFNSKVNEFITAKVNESLARGGPQIGAAQTVPNAMAEIDKAMAGRLF